MIHKGNISKITIQPEDIVDCVIGGSPCQGLSVAGKRLGLSDNRSGLFMEQIRVIREMRELDKATGRTGFDVRPRWGVWENVPGALSSGTPKGEDFRIVLEEFIKVADPKATVPRPERGWNNSGCIVGDGYSLAWRIMDARYHGVPQRRRRITLVVDFAGDCAPKVLFDEEGLRWDFETSQRAWKAIAQHSGSGITVGCGCGLGADLYNGCLTGECAETLNANSCGSSNHEGPSVCQTIAFHMLQDPISGEVSPCLGGRDQCSVGVVLDDQGGSQINVCEEEISPTLRAQMHGHPPIVCKETGKVYAIDPLSSNSMKSSNPYSGFRAVECAKTIDTSTPNPNKNQGGMVVVFSSEGNGQRALHKGDGRSEERVEYTLNSVERHGVVYAIDGNVCDRVSKKNGCGYSEDVSPTLNTQDRHAVVYDARGNGDDATCCTITGDHCNRVTDYTPIAICETVGPLCARDSKGVGTQFVDENKVIVQPFDKQRIGQYGIGETSSTLSVRDYKDASDLICTKTDKKYIVRRLTPLECSRLQGLQDDWCVVPPQETVSDEDLAFWKPFWEEWMQINGKKPKSDAQIVKWLSSPVSESAQYQMYGNGIALPQWVWTLGRIIETYGERKPTMASLFDGTGSFPLIWNSILGGPYTVWSSEVNPDAIRVSKYRIDERWCPNEHSNGNLV